MSSWLQDLRFAWHAVVRRPVSSVTILVLLLGGITTSGAVFGIVQGVLFQSFPVGNPDSVVRLFNTETRGGKGRRSLSRPIYEDYRQQSEALKDLALYRHGIPVHLSAQGAVPERVPAAVVTSNYFRVLAVEPALGRLFTPEDAPSAGGAEVVLSHGLWQRLFGGDPEVVGRRVRINAEPFTIVGVAPRSFALPGLREPPRLWLPFSGLGVVEPFLAGQAQYRFTTSFRAVGRLSPGHSVRQAETELETIAQRLGAGGPAKTLSFGVEWNEPWPRVQSLPEAITPEASRLAWLLFAGVLLLQLVVTANVGSLLLARSERRKRQFAVRLALGARRFRVWRELVLEGALLACPATLGGILVMGWIARWLLELAPKGLSLVPASAVSRADPRTISFAMLVAAVTVALAALGPGYRLLRGRLTFDGATRMTLREPGGRKIRPRHALVVVQTAVAALLLLQGGLLLRTLVHLTTIDSGVAADEVFLASIDPARQGYEPESAWRLVNRLRTRAEALPGVESASISTSSPRRTGWTTVRVPDHGETKVGFTMVDAAFFRTLEIRFLAGRGFDERSAARGTAPGVVNRSFAERYFAEDEGLGRSILEVGPKGTSVEVVGVVEDTLNRGPRNNPGPALYVPVEGFYGHFPAAPRVFLGVRTRLDSDEVRGMLTEELAALDPDIALFGTGFLDDEIRAAFARERFLTWLSIALGLFCLVLAATGLYGVVAHGVEWRRRELAVRAVLGARWKDLAAMVYRQSLGLVLIGLCAGLSLGLFLARAVESMLYGVSRIDATTLAAVSGLLVAVGALATAVPLLRTSRAELMDGLRRD